MQTPQYIYFKTYGCSANQNNTEIMKGLVRQAGLEITNNPDIADLLIINTCIVKEPTEKAIERKISDLRKKYSDKPIIIAGCMPEVRKEKLKKENLFLLGTHHIKDICKLIRKIFENKYNEKDFLSAGNEEKLCQPKISLRKEIGITQISEGCLGNCTFCITKYAKGKLFSYSEEEIIKNIQNDLKSCREIWLTSQDNASYGLEQGNRKLTGLLNKILALKGRFRVKIGMMNPENVLPILPELTKIYKNEKMHKFLHLPLQSGSNEILSRMNRKYKTEDFLKIILAFKKEIPDLIFWTDIIVGFPGETEEDFQKTIKIIKQAKPDFINISRFWPIKGTEASKLKPLPAETIKSRTKKFLEIYNKLKPKVKINRNQ